ncbi:hypothetical protein BTR25_04505 [Bacillus sp. MRMR6]|nr:hypothetical protein BTR25_04505 [Bacillus sp. MRMR6]
MNKVEEVTFQFQRRICYFHRFKLLLSEIYFPFPEILFPFYGIYFHFPKFNLHFVGFIFTF